MKILLQSDIIGILGEIRKAELLQIVGERSRMYEEIGRDYAKDLCLTVTAHEELTVNAQHLLAALVLQLGGSVTIEKKYILQATQSQLSKHDLGQLKQVRLNAVPNEEPAMGPAASLPIE